MLCAHVYLLIHNLCVFGIILFTEILIFMFVEAIFNKINLTNLCNKN